MTTTPSEQAARVRGWKPMRRTAAWICLVCGGLGMLVGLAMFFDRTSQQTEGERMIERAVGVIFFVPGSLMFGAGGLLYRFARVDRCSRCGTTVPRLVSACPGCGVGMEESSRKV